MEVKNHLPLYWMFLYFMVYPHYGFDIIFIQQVFIEHLLYAWHCLSSWEESTHIINITVNVNINIIIW